MKFSSLVYSAVSGSVGGLTYSHNKSGMYTRARAIPTNPATTQQQAIRNFNSALVAAWSNSLTATQRGNWEIFAANMPVTNPLGAVHHLSGQNWFIKNNVARLQSGLSVVTAAPSIFAAAVLTTPGITSVTAATDVAVITFTNTDEWAGNAAGGLLVYTSRPQNAGRSFFKGPYRFAGRIAGAATPPTSPQNINLAFPVSVGQKVFFRFIAVQADSRISASLYLNATAA